MALKRAPWTHPKEKGFAPRRSDTRILIQVYPCSVIYVPPTFQFVLTSLSLLVLKHHRMKGFLLISKQKLKRLLPILCDIKNVAKKKRFIKENSLSLLPSWYFNTNTTMILSDIHMLMKSKFQWEYVDYGCLNFDKKLINIWSPKLIQLKIPCCKREAISSLSCIKFFFKLFRIKLQEMEAVVSWLTQRL